MQSPANQMVDLFVAETFSYPVPQVVSTIDYSVLDCGPVTTTLVGEETNYPELIHYPDDREIYVYGDDPIRHVDQFPLVLQNCITLNGNFAGCANSTTFRVIITNPCTTSNIVN